MGRADAASGALGAHELGVLPQPAAAPSAKSRTLAPRRTARRPARLLLVDRRRRGACGPCGGGSGAPCARRAWPCGRGSRACARGECCGAGRCVSRGAQESTGRAVGQVARRRAWRRVRWRTQRALERRVERASLLGVAFPIASLISTRFVVGAPRSRTLNRRRNATSRPSGQTGEVGADGAVPPCARARRWLRRGPAEAQQTDVPPRPARGAGRARRRRRPLPAVTQKHAIFYAQLGLGLSLNPLRTANITQDARHRCGSPRATSITTQFSTYLSAGFELLDRLTLGVTFPVAWEQIGQRQHAVPALGPVRGRLGPHDVQHRRARPSATRGSTPRYVIDRTPTTARGPSARSSRSSLPTGAGSSTNFGGDRRLPGDADGHRRVAADPQVSLADLRREHRLRLPARDSSTTRAARNGPCDGLGIGDEWRWRSARSAARGRQVPPRRDDLRADRHPEPGDNDDGRRRRSSRRRTRPSSGTSRGA